MQLRQHMGRRAAHRIAQLPDGLCICFTPAVLFHLVYCQGCQQASSALQAKRKRQHMGDLKLVVAGCVAQQEGAQLLRRVPELDLVLGPQHANR